MTFTVSIRQSYDGYWIGQIVELPAVMDQGNSKDELIQNLREALAFYLETERETYQPEPGAELMEFLVI